MANAMVGYDQRRTGRQQFRNLINRVLRYLDALQNDVRFVQHGRFYVQACWISLMGRGRLLGYRNDGPAHRRAPVLKFNGAKDVRSHRFRWISDLYRNIKEGRGVPSHE